MNTIITLTLPGYTRILYYIILYLVLYYIVGGENSFFFKFIFTCSGTPIILYFACDSASELVWSDALYFLFGVFLP